MSGRGFAVLVRRRLLGVALLAIVASLVALSIAVYNQVFTDAVIVRLQTDHTGNQLLPHSDVKERGVIVGEVRSITSHGDGATITLALNPGKAKQIENYDVAQLLPKTLFGERYVALIVSSGGAHPAYCVPDQPPGPIKAGQTICQDDSKRYAELQHVLADLMPLLQALRPAELNATLNALATALSGHGTEIGNDIAKAATYLHEINPHVRQLVDDLDKLGKVAVEYDRAAPALLDTLTNLQTTSRSVVQKQAALDSLLGVATGTSDALSTFLDVNSARLISVSTTSNEILALLKEYAPEYGCLLGALAALEPRLDEAFRGGRLHVTVEMIKQRGKYVPGDEPKLVSGVGPQCWGMPNPAVPFQPPMGIDDGAPDVGGPGTGAMASPMRDAYGPGSAAETHLIDTLIAGEYGTAPDQVPAIATILAASLMRGSQVTAR